MTTMFEDVGEFHKKFGLPVAGARPPTLMNYASYKHRRAFLGEERDEFIEACARGDIAEAADALADLIWVACGAAHLMGIPLDAVWAEVRRANMGKRPWREGDVVKERNLNTAMEVVKPEGWRSPDVQGVLAEFTQGLWRAKA